MTTKVTAFLSSHDTQSTHVYTPTRLSQSSLSLSSSSSSSSSTTINFETFLKPEYHNQIPKLSSLQIVPLLPIIPLSSRDNDTKYNNNNNNDNNSNNLKPLRQELFKSSIISILYERVLPPLWEAGLRIGGPDAEYQAAATFLLDDTNNNNNNKNKKSLFLNQPSPPQKKYPILLDLSCGTGFVAQRFAMSGKCQYVFALDYSPQMLQELVSSCNNNNNNNKLALSIIQGDALQLPFQDSTIDLIHWGAAMHCVPNAEIALQECFRVLKPNGKLYATTFLRPFPDFVFRFFTTQEIESMAQQVGFSSNQIIVEKKSVYGTLMAIKE